MVAEAVILKLLDAILLGAQFGVNHQQLVAATREKIAAGADPGQVADDLRSGRLASELSAQGAIDQAGKPPAV